MTNKNKHKEICKNCKGYPDGDSGECGDCHRMITFKPKTVKEEKKCRDFAYKKNCEEDIYGNCYYCLRNMLSPQPTKEGLEKELRLILLPAEMVKDLEDQIVNLLLIEIKKAREDKEVPMGVSQWRNHGKKYGYAKFFEDQKVKEIREEIERKKRPLPYECKSPFPGEAVDFHLKSYGHLPSIRCCKFDQYTKEEAESHNKTLDNVLSLPALKEKIEPLNPVIQPEETKNWKTW